MKGQLKADLKKRLAAAKPLHEVFKARKHGVPQHSNKSAEVKNKAKESHRIFHEGNFAEDVYRQAVAACVWQTIAEIIDQYEDDLVRAEQLNRVMREGKPVEVPTPRVVDLKKDAILKDQLEKLRRIFFIPRDTADSIVLPYFQRPISVTLHEICKFLDDQIMKARIHSFYTRYNFASPKGFSDWLFDQVFEYNERIIEMTSRRARLQMLEQQEEKNESGSCLDCFLFLFDKSRRMDAQEYATYQSTEMQEMFEVRGVRVCVENISQHMNTHFYVRPTDDSPTLYAETQRCYNAQKCTFSYSFILLQTCIYTINQMP